MIFTSNFANLKNLNIDNCLSIAVKKPYWYKGNEFLQLSPTLEMVLAYKSGILLDDEYTALYNEILNKLNVGEIAQLLDNKILLCWCAKTKFCHRFIVSKWLNDFKKDICKEV